MALVVADRVKETTTSVGTSTINLAGAEDNFESFVTGVGSGNTTYYAIVDKGNSEFEVGIGTVTSGTPDTLSRDTVLASSNSDALVNFSTGSKDVFCTQPAEKAVYLDSSGQLVIDGTAVTATAAELNYVDGVTSNIQTQLDARVDLSGDTMTGALVLSGDPSAALGAATKQYVDNLVTAAIHYHDPVRVESPDSAGNLNATYDNGTNGVGATLTNNSTQAALVIDNVTLATNDRVLIYNQTNGYENGVYTVTNTGSASTNWVLTRATDADSYEVGNPDAFGGGDSFYVTEGDDGAGETYVCNNQGAITFGTTDITFVQISSAQIYTGGTGVTIDGTDISVNVSATAQTTAANSLTTTSSRTYAVQVDGSDNLVVNVPWVDTDTDTDTTYTAGTGLTLSGTQFNVDDDYVLNTGDTISGQLVVESSLNPPVEIKRDAGAVTTGNYVNLRLNTQTSGTPADGLGSMIDFYVDDVIKGRAGYTNDGDFHIKQSDGSTDSITVDSTGSVGIGTTSPSVPLEVNVSGAGDVFKLTRDTGTNGELSIDFAGANANFNSEQGGYTFETSSATNALVLSSAGNVGIGTSSPNTLLTVTKSSSGNVARFDSTSNAQLYIQSNASSVDIIGANSSAGAGPLNIRPSGVASSFSMAADGDITIDKDLYLNGWTYQNVAGQNFVLRSDTATRNTFEWQQGTTRIWTLDLQADGDLDFSDAQGGNNVLIGNQRILTTADEGSGNGLDADTVDGIQGASFLRSDAEDSGVGITLNGGTLNQSNDATFYVTAGGNQDWGIKIGATSGKTEYGQVIEMPASFNYAFRVLKNGSEHFNINSTGATIGGNYIWHAGNDGPSSGLDADTVDGIQGASFLRSDTADTASGDITFSGGAGAISVSAGSDLRFTTGNWTGEYSGKIQYHANHFYFQSASQWILRTSGGSNVIYGDQSGNWTATGAVYSPIFYDSNDSNYYGNFADTSYVKYLGRRAHNTGHLVGSYNNVGSNDAKSNPIYTIGSSYNPGDQALSNMYGIGYSHPNQGSMPSHSGGWGMYVAADGDARVFLDGSNGRLIATSAAYVPIYYDYNNTAYYGDFAGVTRINTLRAGDTIDDTPNGTQFTHVLGANGSSNRVVYFDGAGGSPSVWWGNGNAPYGAIDADTNGLRMYFNNTSGNWYEQFRVTDGYTYSINSSRSPIFYDSGNTGYYCDPAGSSNFNTSVRANEIYARNWFRNDNSAEGLYNQANDNHFFSASANYWHINSDSAQSTGALIFYQGYQSSAGNATNRKGYVYFDTSGFGLLNNGGSWAFRSSGSTTEIYGNVYMPTNTYAYRFYDRNNTGYYLDPASTSVMNSVIFKNKIIGNGLDLSPNFDINNSGGVNISDAIEYLDIEAGNDTTYVEDGMVLDMPWTGVASVNSRFGISVVEGGTTDAQRVSVGQSPLYGDTWIVGNIDHGTGGVAGFQEGILCAAGSSIFIKSAGRIFEIDGVNQTVVASQYSFVGSGYTALSDKTKKENIKPLDFSSQDLQTLGAYTYSFIADKDKKTKVGLIAQEVQDVLPDAVSITTQKDTGETSLSLDYNAVVASLVSVINELTERVNQLELQVGTK